MGLPCGASLVAAGLWAFNPHGVNMSVLWISGRTSLLAAAFAVGASAAAMTDRAAVTFVLMLLALLSKEEVLLLPAAWTVCRWLTRNRTHYRPGFSTRSLVAAWLAVAIYLALRFQTGAMTPADAPWHYRFTLDPAVVTANALEYLDRACTWPAAILLALAFALRRGPSFGPTERTAIVFGTLWLIAGYAVTVALPVRSSLYACLPAIGAAIAAAALANAMWRAAAPRGRWLAAVALGLPLVLWPIYQTRNERWVAQATLSASILEDLPPLADLSESAVVVIQDDINTRANVQSAFGNHLTDAIYLLTRRTLNVFYEPSLEGIAAPAHRDRVLRLQVVEGRPRLRPVQLAPAGVGDLDEPERLDGECAQLRRRTRGVDDDVAHQRALDEPVRAFQRFPLVPGIEWPLFAEEHQRR
jgi:hypothetical protein